MESTEDDTKKRQKRSQNIDLCAQEILKLVARGSAVICEILRLKDYIPEPFSFRNQDKQYKDIIHDFSLLKGNNLDKLEDKFKQDRELMDRDEDFRINNIEVIERFFSLFLSIYQYITDWKTLIKQIKENKFLPHIQ